MQLTESTFELYAAKYYTNHNCIDEQEFIEDFCRLKYIKRLVKKYKQSDDLRERLLLNHLVILYNVFESVACTQMLLFKLKEDFSVIKPFLILMNRLPETITDHENKVIYTSHIPLDNNVVDKIRKNIL
jgi:hypothetical protein